MEMDKQGYASRGLRKLFLRQRTTLQHQMDCHQQHLVLPHEITVRASIHHEADGMQCTFHRHQPVRENPDNNYSRIDDAAKAKVKITLLLLDISKPLPERRNASGYSTESDLDMSDKALQEVYSGAMHVGKHT